jgi:hypothetical protein
MVARTREGAHALETVRKTQNKTKQIIIFL